MDWDDEFDSGYDDIDYPSQQDKSLPDKSAEDELNPMDITNPASAYLFLSDDAQDEISGNDRKNMKCLSCGYSFMGEIYDRCPECLSINTEETV